MMWEVPRMWEGGECWIIGGGPSMPREFGVPEDVISAVLSGEQPLSSYSPYLSPIKDKHVIGINAAFLLGDWVDIVFFGDGDFYRVNKKAMDARTKLKVCCSSTLPNKKFAYGIRFVRKDGNHPVGISDRPGMVSWNLNSGAASVSLAYHLGVKKIYLLGFDMQLGPDDRQHWHSLYSGGKYLTTKDKKALPFHRHLLGFKAMERDAKKLGLEIINVSPSSAITQFRKVALKDIL